MDLLILSDFAGRRCCRIRTQTEIEVKGVGSWNLVQLDLGQTPGTVGFLIKIIHPWLPDGKSPAEIPILLWINYMLQKNRCWNSPYFSLVETPNYMLPSGKLT